LMSLALLMMARTCDMPESGLTLARSTQLTLTDGGKLYEARAVIL
jgi:hypothetical protein